MPKTLRKFNTLFLGNTCYFLIFADTSHLQILSIEARHVKLVFSNTLPYAVDQGLSLLAVVHSQSMAT